MPLMSRTVSNTSTAPPTVQFLGAAGTVTGSKHLVRTGKASVLLDCGMFQGLKELRERNWAKSPVSVSEIDAIVVSHAHIDHTGHLPLVVRQGYRGPIWCTPATAELLPILLLDAAKLQEEDAEHANRKGYSRHVPALPLYTVQDAQNVFKLLHTAPFGEEFSPAEGVRTLFRRAGHILGSASIELRFGSPEIQLAFSGDLGRFGREILRDPEPIPQADVLLLESTYGDRVHSPDPLADLAGVVTEAAQRGGALIVPAFAVDRTQELLWALRRLEDQKRIPVVPVYIDSPMALEVTQLYVKYSGEHRLPVDNLIEPDANPLCCHRQKWIHSVDESKALNGQTGPMIIVSSSGMATGGRVLHHLEHRVSDPHTTVLFVGYQAAGTRGRLLLEGAKTLRLHGRDVPVNAQIRSVEGFSGHADRAEMLRWLGGFQRPPRKTYMVHGEGPAATGLAQVIHDQFGWETHVAEDGEVVPLLGT